MKRISIFRLHIVVMFLKLKDFFPFVKNMQISFPRSLPGSHTHTHSVCVSVFLQGKPDMPTFHQFWHEMWTSVELWGINGTPHGSSESFAQQTKGFADLWRQNGSCTALCCVCIALQSFCNANVDQILRTVKTTNNGHKINNSSSYANKFCQPLWMVTFWLHDHF